jgi:iron complex outermembrane receptor protein
MTVDPDLGISVPSNFDDIADIDRLEPTITQTLELGYKGTISDRLSISVDLYRTEKENFIGPLTVETPNVFLHSDSLAAYLTTEIAAAMGDPGNAAYAAELQRLDSLPNIGDLDGSPIDELIYLYTQGGASIPFGTVSPNEAYDPTAILVTYRNFGDISFYGGDFAFAYHLNQNWNLGGMYSYISKNFFEKDDNQVHDIHLNSPKHKFALHLQYVNPKWGLDVHTRFRFVDAFDMDSPFYGSTVESYRLVDVNVGVGFIYETRMALTVQNLFDERHIEFIGGPKLGRLAILRLTRTL